LSSEPSYVLPVDYNRYVIAKHCPFDENECKYVFVSTLNM